MRFVNRESELAQLERWWDGPGGRLGIVWGRRRVGKSALLGRFAAGKRAVVHTAAARPASDELRRQRMSPCSSSSTSSPSSWP